VSKELSMVCEKAVLRVDGKAAEMAASKVGGSADGSAEP
jgi:hypothetical protein